MIFCFIDGSYCKRKMWITGPMLAVIGAVSGLLMGLIGIGGGVVTMVLLIEAIGFTLQQAVATTLFIQLVPQTLPGVVMYYRSGKLDIAKSLLVVVGSFIGVFVGSYLSTKGYVSERALMRTFIVSLFCMTAYFAVRYW